MKLVLPCMILDWKIYQNRHQRHTFWNCGKEASFIARTHVCWESKYSQWGVHHGSGTTKPQAGLFLCPDSHPVGNSYDFQWTWVLAFIPPPIEMGLLGIGNSNKSQYPFVWSDFDAANGINIFHPPGCHMTDYQAIAKWIPWQFNYQHA